MALSRRIVSGVDTPKDQWLNDAISRMMREVADELVLSYGEPTRIHYESHNAVLGSLDQNDPSGGGFTVRLPAFDRKDIGKCITVCNVSTSTNNIVIQAQNGTVNGYSSVTVGKSKFVRQAMALNAENNEWLLTTVLDGATSAAQEPFWTWNGIDTTQFDSLVVSSNLVSGAVSTASLAGKTWVEITVNSNTSDTVSNLGCVLPIDVTPPSADYRITFDLAWSQNDNTQIVQGAVARWSAAAGGSGVGTMYYGYQNASVSTTGHISSGVASANPKRNESTTPYGASLDWQTCEFTVKDEALIRLNFGLAENASMDTSSPITSAGQPGLWAGLNTGGGVPNTIIALYSNIKCWEVT